MNRNKDKTKKHAIIAISIIMAAIIASIFANQIRTARSACLSPAEKAAAGTGKSISSCAKSIPELLSAAEDNKKLKAENERLKREITDLNICRSENIRLRALLELKKKSQQKTIAAEICGRDSESWFFRFEINKGSKDGVKKQMIAMSDKGLVGKVTAVYPRTSLVRTILHKNSMIPAYAVEAGAFAMLSGEGGGKAVLRYIYNSSLIDSGQLVITSGLGDIYPRGIPIGITEKNKKGEMEVRTFDDLTCTDKILLFERGEE